MKCTADLLDTQDIDIVNCRFLGTDADRRRVCDEDLVRDVTTMHLRTVHAVPLASLETTPDLQGLVFVNNTFHAYQRAIVFQDNPLTKAERINNFGSSVICSSTARGERLISKTGSMPRLHHDWSPVSVSTGANVPPPKTPRRNSTSSLVKAARG